MGQSPKPCGCAAQSGGEGGTACLMSYRGVVEDDITAGHVAVENVLLQVLNERSLQSRRGRVRWIFRFPSAHFNSLRPSRNAHRYNGQTSSKAKRSKDCFFVSLSS